MPTTKLAELREACGVSLTEMAELLNLPLPALAMAETSEAVEAAFEAMYRAALDGWRWEEMPAYAFIIYGGPDGAWAGTSEAQANGWVLVPDRVELDITIAGRRYDSGGNPAVEVCWGAFVPEE